MSVSTDFLNKVPYLKGLSDSDIELLKRYFVEKTVGRGEIIELDGQQSRALYFVVSGAVKLFKTSVDGKEQILGIVRPGDTFNDVPVFDSGPNTTSSQAMSDLILYELDRSALEFIVQKYPQVATNVIRILAARIRGLVALVEDLSFRNVIGRVAKILLNTAESNMPRLTQHEMAAMAGTAREVVGRSLKAMEDEGMVKIEHHRITIKDKEALKDLARSGV